MNQNRQICNYASMALASTAGGVIGVDVTADVVTFDVGVTISVSIGGTNTSIASSTQIQMEPLGVSMEFAVDGFYSQNSTNSDSFLRRVSWDIMAVDGSFNGDLRVAMGPFPFLQSFGPGGSVGSNEKWTFWSGQGGNSFEEQTPAKSFSTAGSEGIVDGEAYIGFRFKNEGFGDPTYNYGWFELDVSLDATGASLTIERWGYETEVDTAASIPAAPVVPGPAGLFALAVGAAGVRSRRQRIA